MYKAGGKVPLCICSGRARACTVNRDASRWILSRPPAAAVSSRAVRRVLRPTARRVRLRRVAFAIAPRDLVHGRLFFTKCSVAVDVPDDRSRSCRKCASREIDTRMLRRSVRVKAAGERVVIATSLRGRIRLTIRYCTLYKKTCNIVPTESSRCYALI